MKNKFNFKIVGSGPTGLLAHQLVIMGSPGETYTIKHDTIDRKAYMPGVLQAIKKIVNYETLDYGLEKLIF